MCSFFYSYPNNINFPFFSFFKFPLIIHNNKCYTLFHMDRHHTVTSSGSHKSANILNHINHPHPPGSYFALYVHPWQKSNRKAKCQKGGNTGYKDVVWVSTDKEPGWGGGAPHFLRGGGGVCISDQISTLTTFSPPPWRLRFFSMSSRWPFTSW